MSPLQLRSLSVFDFNLAGKRTPDLCTLDLSLFVLSLCKTQSAPQVDLRHRLIDDI